MPTDTATAIAYIGAFAGLTGGGVALFNSWKAVCWKRAELANAYLRELNSSQELVFACRALDWHAGRLVVPDSLRPLLQNDERVISHDPAIFERAMRAVLYTSELDEDPRIQIYRTSMDSLFSWLSVVASALDRKLFYSADVHEVSYWNQKIEDHPFLEGFIVEYGYMRSMESLKKHFPVASRRSE